MHLQGLIGLIGVALAELMVKHQDGGTWASISSSCWTISAASFPLPPVHWWTTAAVPARVNLFLSAPIRTGYWWKPLPLPRAPAFLENLRLDFHSVAGRGLLSASPVRPGPPGWLVKLHAMAALFIGLDMQPFGKTWQISCSRSKRPWKDIDKKSTSSLLICSLTAACIDVEII